MRIRRFTAALTAAVCLCSMTGCSERVSDLMNELLHPDEYFQAASPDDIDPETAFAFVEDAEGAIANVKYEPEMFYGKYIADGAQGTEFPEEARTDFLDEMPFTEVAGIEEKVTALPFRIEAGPHSYMTPLNYLSGYHWMLLYLLGESGTVYPVEAGYTLSGNSLDLRLLESVDYDAQANRLDYAFSETELHYYYAFSGQTLRLNCDGKYAVLHPEELTEGHDISIKDANLNDGSEALQGIEIIELEGDSGTVTIDGQKLPLDYFSFKEDGHFHIAWTGADGVRKAGSLGYFYCDDDGLILTDGTGVFFYNERSWDMYSKEVTTNLRIEDADKIGNLSDAELDALVTEIGGLYTDLEAALAEAGINAAVDQSTGEIALDSVVLFGVDSADLAAEGENMLRGFLKAYTSVIFSEKYDGFVSSVEIEGHTDPTGSPEHNMSLSQERANRVLNFCTSDYNGLDEETTARLTDMLYAQGYASSRPVTDASGRVDDAASRRVSFRFMIDLG